MNGHQILTAGLHASDRMEHTAPPPQVIVAEQWDGTKWVEVRTPALKTCTACQAGDHETPRSLAGNCDCACHGALPECDGCQITDYEGELVAVYEGDDPDTGYRGSSEPEYLCWECRHPHAAARAATETSLVSILTRLRHESR